MHFFKLLPCVIALATPALGNDDAPTGVARLYSEEDFKGHSLVIDNYFHCVTLSGDLHRNVQSIEVHRAPIPFLGFCQLFSSDGCAPESRIGNTVTASSLNETDVASVSCIALP
ncbi:hypothetical protein GGI43DRAFT_393357 [Trichoderma evansii]